MPCCPCGEIVGRGGHIAYKGRHVPRWKTRIRQHQLPLYQSYSFLSHPLPSYLKMQTKLLLGGAALAAFSMIPSCPAPMVAAAVITGIAAPLAGNLIYIGLNDNVKRSDSGFVHVARALSYPGVSDEAIQQCKDSNNGKTDVKVTQTDTTCKS